MSDPVIESPPLVWRVPPYQPALLILVATAFAALNIYFHPSATARIATIAIGLLCLGLAFVALRMHLIADDDGVAVRHLRTEAWTPWAVLQEFEIIDDARGASTIRVNRVDGTFVDVPASLLQPTKPTAKRLALVQLDLVVRQLKARRPARR